MNIDKEIKLLQQLCIEDMYAKHNIRQKVKKDIGEELPDVMNGAVELLQNYVLGNYYPSKNRRLKLLLMTELTPEDIVLEVLIAVLLIQEVQPIQNACAQIGIRLGYEDVFDGIRTAAEILAVLAELPLFTLYMPGVKGTYLSINSNFKLSDPVIAAINQCKYLPPMICEPKDWENNKLGGNLSVSNSVLLGKENHHEEEQALDALNLIQKIGFCLDPYVLAMDEVLSKPLDTKEKQDNHTQMVVESNKVYADLINQGNEFYFVWRYDKRGRMYSQGYHVNLQSYSYKKALLNFTKKEYLI